MAHSENFHAVFVCNDTSNEPVSLMMTLAEYLVAVMDLA